MSADRVIVNSGNRDNGPVRHTAWGAVFAGAIIALMITFLLNLLFAGIGLANFDPATSNNPLSGYGTGSIIAIIVINVVALFIGGLVAGRLSGTPRRGDAVIHGILTWSLLTIGTILLLSTAIGRIVGGVAGLVGNTVSSVAQGAAAVAPGAANAIPNQLNVQGQINQFLTDAGVQNPEQTGQQLVQRIVQRVQNGESLTSPDAQNEFKTFLANNSNLSEQEINQQVQQFTQQVDQTANQVVQTTQEVASIAGTTAYALFGALLLGAIIAIFGALAGAPKDSFDARV